MAKSEIKNLTDSCGKIVNISEHATMMVPFYYLPLIVLLVLLIKKPFIKMIRLVVIKINWNETLAGFFIFVTNLFTADT